MRIGYAHVSTREQSFNLQVDALEQAGCEKVYTEAASGARTERPVLDELLRNLRSGDVLVIWKLDRLGRSLKHLVELVGILMDKGVGLQSLHDPVDTTTPHGRLTFNIFASLAEFERDVIRERTQAGLAAARCSRAQWRTAQGNHARGRGNRHGGGDAVPRAEAHVAANRRPAPHIQEHAVRLSAASGSRDRRLSSPRESCVIAQCPANPFPPKRCWT